MKNITLFFISIFLIYCSTPSKKNKVLQQLNNGTNVYDTAYIENQITKFNTSYDKLIKDIGDSVSKIKGDWGYFSELTIPLEKKYSSSKSELGKMLLGYKLAGNYMIHYDSTKKMEYLQKAEPLFYSFLSYNNGILASKCMKLDLKKVQFMQKEWSDFSDQDKETILFYGLLRGFENGLPEILKNK